MSPDPTTPAGVENVAVLDLTGHDRDDLAAISHIENVALVLVPESLTGALARIPTRRVASVVPVPDGLEVHVHTGTAVFGGEALANPAVRDAVLVVTGSLVLSSPVTDVAYRQVIVSGIVLAPFGSEGALGAGLTRVTGGVQYFRHAEGQRFQTLSGQTSLAGSALANDGGSPDDLLFLTGQTIVTGEITTVGYQQVVVAGQLLAPRDGQHALLPRLHVQGQTVWYGGRPRPFTGEQRFDRPFFELLDDPLDLLLLGTFTIGDDVDAALLKDKLGEVTLVGRLDAPAAVVPVLQLRATEVVGSIVASEQVDGAGQ